MSIKIPILLLKILSLYMDETRFYVFNKMDKKDLWENQHTMNVHLLMI